MEKEESIIQNSEIFRERNISLILEGYHDIFSDFDPRPFSERAISDDFLLECKRAAIDKAEHGIEIILSVPKTIRNSADESKIKQRLKEHFHKHYLRQEKEINKTRKEGIIWVLIGAAFLSGILYGIIRFQTVILNAFFTILEVPSWFLMWEGMNKILLEPRKEEPEFRFYHKMANAHILFKGY
jgi:hypothetical protein